MNQRITSSILAVVSGIGLMIAMVAVAIQIPRTAYALECFSYLSANSTTNQKYDQLCGDDHAACNSMRDAQIKNGVKNATICDLD